MSAPESTIREAARVAPPLSSIALAQLAPVTAESGAAPEATWLVAQRDLLAPEALELERAFAWWRAAPPPEDVRLHGLAVSLDLSPPECLAVALALAADRELIAGRALAWLQAPLADPHPTVGLVACLEEQRGRSPAETLADIVDGAAVATGLLVMETPERPIPDARLRIPLPLVTALAGGTGRWKGIRFSPETLPALPAAVRAEAARRASALDGAMVVRSGSAAEARALCAMMATSRGRRGALLEADVLDGAVPAGLGPWLRLHTALPVWCADLGPGERGRIPRIPGYAGPMLVASGPEGTWEDGDDSLPAWTVPVPTVSERVALWREHGLSPEDAAVLGRVHRQGGGRITRLVHDAHAVRQAAGEAALERRHVEEAARRAERDGLGALAEPLPEDIGDDALVLPPPLRTELDALSARCRVRDELSEGLGPAVRARYRPAVRALLVGPSGTGKTLACGWLATRLGLPLYRVDLAAVSSKYIGETEKNLGELFARAEHAGVVLMFDEADALFGKRTDVKDAHDRYANQQTNYLLQRIESYDGIVLLTSNSRARFDSAFTRRLDVILEFPMPQPQERRALWRAHLGPAQGIGRAELNRLAAGCELAGGHIRNVVLAARAESPDGDVAWPALERALAAEYRKLGKQLPSVLAGEAR